MRTRTMRMSRMIPMIIPAPNPPPSSWTTLGPPAGGFTLTWPNLNLLALSRPTLSQAACREGALVRMLREHAAGAVTASLVRSLHGRHRHRRAWRRGRAARITAPHPRSHSFDRRGRHPAARTGAPVRLLRRNCRSAHRPGREAQAADCLRCVEHRDHVGYPALGDGRRLLARPPLFHRLPARDGRSGVGRDHRLQRGARARRAGRATQRERGRLRCRPCGPPDAPDDRRPRARRTRDGQRDVHRGLRVRPDARDLHAHAPDLRGRPDLARRDHAAHRWNGARRGLRLRLAQQGPALAPRSYVHRKPGTARHPDPPAVCASRGEPPRRDHDRPRPVARGGGDDPRELHRAARRRGTPDGPHAPRIGGARRCGRHADRARARLAVHRRRFRRARNGVDELHHLRLRAAPARGPRADPRTRERGLPHHRAHREQHLGPVPLGRGRRVQLLSRLRGRGLARDPGRGRDVLHAAPPLQLERASRRGSSEPRSQLISTFEHVLPGARVPDPRPGDFILTHGGEFFSRLIQLGQGLRYTGADRQFTYWNHTALIVSAEGAIVEALGPGVRRNTLGDYDQTQYTVVHIEASDEDRAEMVAFAEHWIGARYDWATIVSIAISLVTGAKLSFGFAGQLICSGLVARALERTAAIFEEEPSHVMPAGLAKMFAVAPPPTNTPKGKPARR